MGLLSLSQLNNGHRPMVGRTVRVMGGRGGEFGNDVPGFGNPVSSGICTTYCESSLKTTGQGIGRHPGHSLV